MLGVIPPGRLRAAAWMVRMLPGMRIAIAVLGFTLISFAQSLDSVVTTDQEASLAATYQRIGRLSAVTRPKAFRIQIINTITTTAFKMFFTADCMGMYVLMSHKSTPTTTIVRIRLSKVKASPPGMALH